MVEVQRRSPVVKEEAPAKDASPVVYSANADSKKIKHYKPKVLARQRNNYGYGNARVMHLGTVQAVSFSADP